MEAAFDRGEVDRASLDATERLRARLAGKPIVAPRPPRRLALPWIIVALLLVFGFGMIANPWFEANVRSNMPFASRIKALPAPDTAISDRSSPPIALPALPIPAGVPAAERLARTEARIDTSSDQIARAADRIDRLTADVAALSATIAAREAHTTALTAAATTAADRAQAMLTLVLARRAIDAGRPLGALDAQLRQSFEARYPQAVGQVLALGAAPLTPAILARRLEGLRAVIGVQQGAARQMGWWETLTTTISATVSRQSKSDPGERAIAAMAEGDVAGAAAQLRRLPPPRPAGVSNWLAAADRWRAGTAALATLETATLVPLVLPSMSVAAPVSVPLSAPPALTPNPDPITATQAPTRR